MSEILGVTFPIPQLKISRFFEDGKTVFIKPATVFKELKKGDRFIFYQSQKDTGYVGDAIIKSITLREDPLEFFEICGDKIFLTKKEVRQYLEENKKWKHFKNQQLKRKKSRQWMAIELGKIKKYPEVKKIDGFVPVSGMYIKK